MLADKPDDRSGGAGTGPFHVKMRKHHGYQFGRGDIVRLRTRPLPTSATSDRLKINRMLADGDLIELVLLPGSTLNKDVFPAGSILISPKRKPDNPDGTPGDDLELVDPTVRARINATHNPLNAKDGDPPNRPCTAIPGRNAVTFSGNPSPDSARNRSVHSRSTARVASYSRSASSAGNFCVRASGDSPARWRISSE